MTHDVWPLAAFTCINGSTCCLNNRVSFVVLQAVDQYPDTKVFIMLAV